MKNDDKITEKKNWNNIVNSDENSTIYNFYEWGDILESVENQEFIRIREGNCIIPLSLVKSIVFGNRLISMPFSDYGGPSYKIFNENELVKAIHKIKNVADFLNVNFVEIRCPYEPTISYFEENGFIKKIEYVTFKIDLEKDEKQLWSNIDTERRTAIRKAEENKLKYIEAQNKEDLNDFYLLYLQRMKGIGSPPQPFKYFEKLWVEFFPDNLRLSFVCTNDGKRIASALFLKYGKTLHYTYGSSSADYWDLRPNDFLFWCMIKQGHKEKYKILDLGRTRVGSGVYLFKKKWGGSQLNMPYLYYFRKNELKERQEIKYERFSELWRKYMPFFLTKHIGPWLIKQIG